MKFNFSDIKDITSRRQPDFNNLLKVLNKQKPNRHTLFEYFLNAEVEEKLAGYPKPDEEAESYKQLIKAFRFAGYDYCTINASDFGFYHKENSHGLASVSVNEGGVVWDRQSYDQYVWSDPKEYYNGRIDKLTPFLPEGMKFIVGGPCGVLENVTAITGYDNLCYMLADDPDLVKELFDQVGLRLVDYYSQIIDYDSVGAIISNDDWGFNTQTMLSTDDMRKYVFKWHKKIVDLAHNAGKPVILHSCGNLSNVIDDIIYDLKFDAKHSYEDKILPVEQAYDLYAGKIAVLGGIDLDFVCRSTPEAIFNRSKAMLEKSDKGGYALGTGNSVPYYVPHENYLAMIAAALT